MNDPLVRAIATAGPAAGMDDTASRPPPRIAAGIVLFHPCEGAARLIDACGRQFEAVFLVENESNVYTEERWKSTHSSCVHLRKNSKNAGLSKAINQICRAAREKGFEWLLLFDQDSEISPDFLAGFTRLFASLKTPPALLAANYRTEVCGEAVPGYRLRGQADIDERVTDINAGSLINVPVHHKVGGHCEALFIDHVDHEYCLRLRRRGYSVLATREPLFNHEIGNIVCARRFGRVWQSSGHTPARRREATEALIRVIKLYWRDEPGWCARTLFLELPRSVLAMLILERKRIAKLGALSAGFVRGLFRSKPSVP